MNETPRRTGVRPAHGEVLDLDHHLPAAPALRPAQLQRRQVRFRRLQARHAVEELLAGLRLARVLAGDVAPDELLLALDLGPLQLERPPRLLAAGPALAAVAGVPGGVALEPAAVQLEDLAAHPVHELAVVRHEEQGSVAPRQLLRQELDADEVEVVGGLVEEQQRRPREQRARQGDPRALPPESVASGRACIASGMPRPRSAACARGRAR